jgi:hypothetical protein
MLDPTRLQQALAAKRDDFLAYGLETEGLRRRYADAWQVLSGMAMADIFTAIDRTGVTPGARPTTEWAVPSQRLRPFGRTFASHAEIHEWAAAELAGRWTVSADGSQIDPPPDLLLPVAVVQVSQFANPHRADVPYFKDAAAHVLSPVDLTRGPLEPKSEMVCQRFEKETAALIAVMRRVAGTSPMPVAFYDGPLVVHFAERAVPHARDRYLAAIQALLDASRATRIPVVGYIDSSAARDLATLAGLMARLPDDTVPPDALLVSGVLPQWGDRTAAAACDRGGILDSYAEGARAVAFCYVRTHSGLPSRLEFPLWVVEQGLLDEVVATVLAEAAVGQGYPYALEVADATAVLSIADRARFERALQAFADQEEIPLPKSHKALSKGRRR